MMRNNCFRLLIFLIFIYSFEILTIGNDENKHPYQRVKLETIEHSKKELFKYSDDLYFATDHVEKMDRGNEYGIRLVLLKKVDNGYKTLYISEGSMDSYDLNLTFFQSKNKLDPLIILGEIGAEYSWGVRVFLLYDGKRMRFQDIGCIDVGIIETFGKDLNNKEVTNIESVVPYIVIERKNKRIIFTFTKDVIFNPGGEKQQKFSREAIQYIYDGNKLFIKRKESDGASRRQNRRPKKEGN